MKFFIITKRQILWCASAMLAVVIAVIGSAATLASSDRKLSIYCVETEKKQIAISFDAACGNDYAEQLIKIMGDYNVSATVGKVHKYRGFSNSKLQKNRIKHK